MDSSTSLTPGRARITGADCYWPRAILYLDLSPWLAALPRHDAAARAARCEPIRRALSDLGAAVDMAGAREIFVEVTHGQRRHGTPERMARHARTRVASATGGWSGVIGVGSTWLNARYASTLATSSGVGVITPWESCARLRDAPVRQVFPTGPRLGAFLAARDIATCGAVAALPADLLTRRFGTLGRQLWLACQGRDLGSAVRDRAPPQTVAQSKVLPPRTTRTRTLETYLRHMCDRVASRLRRLDLHATRLQVGLRCAAPAASVDAVVPLDDAAPDGRRWFELARPVLREHKPGEPVLELRVTAAQLANRSGQLELFTPDEVAALRPGSGDDPAGHPDDELVLGF